MFPAVSIFIFDLISLCFRLQSYKKLPKEKIHQLIPNLLLQLVWCQILLRILESGNGPVLDSANTSSCFCKNHSRNLPSPPAQLLWNSGVRLKVLNKITMLRKDLLLPKKALRFLKESKQEALALTSSFIGCAIVQSASGHNYQTWHLPTFKMLDPSKLTLADTSRRQSIQTHSFSQLKRSISEHKLQGFTSRPIWCQKATTDSRRSQREKSKIMPQRRVRWRRGPCRKCATLPIGSTILQTFSSRPD